MSLALTACTREEVPVPPVDSDTVAPVLTSQTYVRRLSRSEYQHTVNSLLHTEVEVSSVLPTDPPVWGFDRTREALHLSPLLVEAYDQAAVRVADAILDRSRIEAQTVPLAPLVSDDLAVTLHEGGARVVGAGHVAFGGVVKLAGPFVLEVAAGLAPGALGASTLALSVDGVPTGGTFALPVAGGVAPWRVDLNLVEGAHRFSLQVTAEDPAAQVEIGGVTLQGPLGVAFPGNPAWQAVMVCDPAAATSTAHDCMARVLDRLLPLAWRRPPTAEEEAELLAVFDAAVALEAPPREAAGYTLRSVFLSPNFLFHRDVMVSTDGGAPVLDGLSVASRLSYFLLSAPPEGALVTAANQGQLATAEGRVARMRQMWDTSQSSTLIDDFLMGWLASGKDPVFDSQLFPGALDVGMLNASDAALRVFLADAMRVDHPLSGLITRADAPVDAALAAFYGVALPDPTSPALQWVDLSSVGRRGLLGQPAVLRRLSLPTRHSIVKRGNWVLDALLCQPVAGPPPNVPPLDTTAVDAPTQREQLEQHRADPACAVCHDRIDPVGVAFEHFDALGAWRDDDGGHPVDATGHLVDGTAFDGLAQLADAIGAGPAFSSCAVEKLYTYALGERPRGPVAEQAVADMQAAAQDPNVSLFDLVEVLVRSDAFVSAPGGAP